MIRLLFLTLIFSGLTQALFAVCMSGWPNDFIIGEEIGETNEVRKSFNGRVVRLSGYLYYFGELMPTDRNECGELIFTPVFANIAANTFMLG